MRWLLLGVPLLLAACVPPNAGVRSDAPARLPATPTESGVSVSGHADFGVKSRF